MLDDPLCRLAVPFGRDCSLLPLPCHESCERRRQLARIGPNEFVGPHRDGLGPLGIIAQGQARYAEHGGLSPLFLTQHGLGILFIEECSDPMVPSLFER